MKLDGEIKQKVNHFVVEEVLTNGEICSVNYKLKEKINDFLIKFKKKDNFVWFDLVKENWETFRLIRIICKKLKCKRKEIHFAGIKDKFAITCQKFSLPSKYFEKLKQLHIEKVKFKNFSYKRYSYKRKYMYGNKFTITIVNIPYKRKEIIEILDKLLNKIKDGYPNLFGEQRFGGNEIVGKYILLKDYQKAVNYFLFKEEVKEVNYKASIKGFWEKLVLKKLVKYKNYKKALRALPKEMITFFINAYQSYLFNKIALNLWYNNFRKNLKLPIPGLKVWKCKDEEVNKVIDKVVKKEKISREMFNTDFGKFNGTFRDYLVKVENFRIIKVKDGTLTISFTLKKGSYATVFLNFLNKGEFI